MIRDIEIAGWISPDALDARDRPLLVRGGARNLRALARWSPAYLAERLGDVELAFKQSANGKHPNFHAATLPEQFARGRAKARELLASIGDGPHRLFTGDEEPLVQRRAGVAHISSVLAPLLDDLVLPAEVAEDRLYTIWAWFSGPGVQTWLHYDNNGCHNLNAQITGEKSCLLFAPDQLARLEPFALGGGNPAHNCFRTDVFDADLSGVPRILARLVPGDLLFIPAWWLHAFDHVGAFNANVNWWWKPARPIDCAPARRH